MADNKVWMDDDRVEEQNIVGAPLGYIDPAAEARVRHKLDWNLMPLLFILYLLDALDRGNIGNAIIAGMEKDLKISSAGYQWLLTIFYITYVIFEFSILLWKIFPPHMVAAIVIFCWGLISTLQAATVNWSGAMALRFLLGAFEAAFAPGVIYLLSFFYLRNEVGFRVGLFASAAPLASTFAGALAYGITSNQHEAIRSWRVLFLVEGLPTIAMAPIAWFFIPDRPDKARFLSPEQKEIAQSRAIRQTGMANRVGGLNVKQVLKAMLDLKMWFNALMYFCANVSYASLPVYLPTILKNMGYSSINAQGLSAPPYFVAFLFAIITTYIADKSQQRGLVLVATSLVGGIGYIVLATVKTVGVRYFATFLASAGVFSTIPNILAWTINNQGSDSGRGGALVLINLIGQCGPFLGTRLFPTTEAPRYIKGMSICAAFMFFSAVLALALRTLLAFENKKLDRKHNNNNNNESGGSPLVEGKPGMRDDGVAVEDYGPNFRYVL